MVINKRIDFIVKTLLIIISILLAGEIAARAKYFSQNDHDWFFYLTPFIEVNQTNRTEHGLFLPQDISEKYDIKVSDYPEWMNTKYQRPCRDRWIYSECSDEKLPVSYNRYCWRGTDIELIKDENTLRIIFVGGSALESVDITDIDLFTSNLEKKLNSSQILDKNVECINAGHAAYDSGKINQMLNNKGFLFKPDVVVYFEAFNEQVGAQGFFDIQNKLIQIGDNIYIGWFHRIFYLRSFLYTYLVEKSLFMFREEYNFIVNREYTENNFRKTIADCRQNGSKLIYLTQPIDFPLDEENGLDLTDMATVTDLIKNPNELSSYKGDSIPALNQRLAQAIQLKVCREMGIPIIDVRTRFHKEKQSGRPMFNDMVHRTCQGESILADEIFSQRQILLN